MVMAQTFTSEEFGSYYMLLNTQFLFVCLEKECLALARSAINVIKCLLLGVLILIFPLSSHLYCHNLL